jgi:hypothetical protein
MVVEREGRRRHRFVLPAEDPISTESWVRDRARAHRLRTNRARRPVSRLLTASVVVAAAATLTVLLLAAAHVINF